MTKFNGQGLKGINTGHAQADRVQARAGLAKRTLKQIQYPLRHRKTNGQKHKKTDLRAGPQCARTDLNKRFLPKPMTTTG